MLDLVIVYGAEPSALMQAPGGRANAKMVGRASFGALSLPDASGNYFLRPDRILALFVLDGAAPPAGRELCAARLEAEVARDLDTKAWLATAQASAALARFLGIRSR